MSERVRHYWTKRAHDFGTIRRNELKSDLKQRWLAELSEHMPKGKSLHILDVGTGAGFFAILLAEQGHRVCGIDLTPAMLDEAKRLAGEKGLDISFLQMDAQKLAFPADSFDVVISRNLTWTLPDPETAYREWLRVLRTGGVLLNFDANYAEQILHENGQNKHVPANSPYGHIGMTKSLAAENAQITLSMPLSKETRPKWDETTLRALCVTSVCCDLTVGKRILREADLTVAPLFMVKAIK